MEDGEEENETQENNEEEEEEECCPVCLVGERSHVLIDCGHLILCRTCVENFRVSVRQTRTHQKNCPICRKQITRSPVRVIR